MDRRALISLLADGRFRSGRAVAEALGVSRSAVWKQLAALRELGLEVDAVRGRGYRLRRPLEPLSAEAMLAVRPDLDPARLHLLDHTGSTNAWLLQRADAPDGCVVVAEAQGQGRGRRGRSWSSPWGGGLWFSQLWRLEELGPQAGALALVAGVGVMRALEGLALPGLGLKWPNDIMVGERKLGGILVELVGEAGGRGRAVVGVGLNVDLPTAAGPADRPWTDLTRALGRTPSRNRLLAELIHALDAVRAALHEQGLGALLDAWRGYDLLRDQPVEVLREDERWSGVARGLGADGALLVEGPEGAVAVHSGEVSLRPRP